MHNKIDLLKQILQAENASSYEVDEETIEEYWHDVLLGILGPSSEEEIARYRKYEEE